MLSAVPWLHAESVEGMVSFLWDSSNNPSPPPLSIWPHSDNCSNQYILLVSRAVALYLRTVSLIRLYTGVAIILRVNVMNSVSASNSDDLKILSSLSGRHNKCAVKKIYINCVRSCVPGTLTWRSRIHVASGMYKPIWFCCPNRWANAIWVILPNVQRKNFPRICFYYQNSSMSFLMMLTVTHGIKQGKRAGINVQYT